MHNESIQTAVVGVSGYAGMELARLLLHHPRLKGTPPVFVGRVEEARVRALGQPASAAGRQSRLLRISARTLFLGAAARSAGSNCCSWRRRTSSRASWVPEALAQRTARHRSERRVAAGRAGRIAPSTSLQMTDAAAGRAGCRRRASTECRSCIAKSIRNARLVANPGCYATSIILALKPLVAAGWVDLEHGIVCDSKSGVSGAGKAADGEDALHVRADNLSAYAVFSAIATPARLLEQLGLDGDADHLHTAPVADSARNSFDDLRAFRRAEDEAREVRSRAFAKFFAASPMVRVFGTQLPQIQYSVRTNYCDIGFQAGEGRATMRDRFLPRQPAERRCGAGGAEHEPDVRLGRSGGPGMKFVVKLGGATLEDPALLHGCAQAIAELVRDGNQVALVHGGGVQLTRTLKQMGKQSEFISRPARHRRRDARRRADGAGRPREQVAGGGAAARMASPAMGLSGGDGTVFRARKKRTAPDLGFVGEIVAVGSAVARGHLEDGRGAGDLEPRARLRRRVLQHQRGRDGRRMRDLHARPTRWSF